MNISEKTNIITNTMSQNMRKFFNFSDLCEEEDNPFTINLNNLCERQIGPILFHKDIWIKSDGQDLTTICIPEPKSKEKDPLSPKDREKANHWLIAQRIAAYYLYFIYPVERNRNLGLVLKPCLFTPQKHHMAFIENLTMRFLMPEHEFLAKTRNLNGHISQLSETYNLPENIIKERLNSFRDWKDILKSHKKIQQKHKHLI